MKLLYVASEGAPYSASGGLGDVIGALPKSVAALDSGISAEVILPLYGNMRSEHREKLEHVADICFKLSWRTTGASIYKITNESVTYYFVIVDVLIVAWSLADARQLSNEFSFSVELEDFIHRTGINGTFSCQIFGLNI